MDLHFCLSFSLCDSFKKSENHPLENAQTECFFLRILATGLQELFLQLYLALVKPHQDYAY